MKTGRLRKGDTTFDENLAILSAVNNAAENPLTLDEIAECVGCHRKLIQKVIDKAFNKIAFRFPQLKQELYHL